MSHLEYILGYGLCGEFGRFRAAAPLPLSRGDQAIIRSDRGVEIGHVLRPATSRHAHYLPNTTVGALLRPLRPEDEAHARQMAQRGGELLARGEQLIQTLNLPLALLDAEVLFDGEHAALHHLHWGQCDVRDLVSTLSREFDLTITLIDLTAPVEEHADHGCGSCGSEGGCGSCGSKDGCGSCGSAAPDEVRAHFAQLREQMEQRRTPLL